MVADLNPSIPLSETLFNILHGTFGYAAFRGQQEAVVQHVTNGGDALVLMPTGGGKSLCFQIPAIARQQAGRGVTVVVSPLIALMHDQVGALLEAGVNAAYLNSSLSSDENFALEKRLMKGEVTLLYAAPERVTNLRFLAQLDSLYERGLLSLFAIDEAHCVSQWGHDFRPEYRGLSILHERFASVPRIALTATADDITRADIIERLQLQTAATFISSFDRPNIRYRLVEKKDPTQQLLRFIQTEHAGDAGIVYAQSRNKVESLAQTLSDKGILALPYHAGLDAKVRQHNQDRFLREDGWVMVATIAFGMGIDKPDVRFVAHVDMPKNIEAYYQETGRAGRDGEPADAWMSYGLQDVVNQRRMIDESPAGDDFKHIMRGKLDALLSLAEQADCRRVRLLSYFGEEYRQFPDEPPLGFSKSGDAKLVPTGGSAVREATSVGALKYRCGNCDNCLDKPNLWDGTDAARKLLSTIYRVQQMSGINFGAGHIMDILRGKKTDKVQQFGHEAISTFGLGANYSETQLRSVLRQLIATGALNIDASAFNTLQLNDASRAVLKGDVKVMLREPSKAEPANVKTSKRGTGALTKTHVPLDLESERRFAALKAWRFEVARAHNLPAYVIFHDATLIAIAQQNPQALHELADISGMGAKKLEAYGAQVLRVVQL